MFAAPSIISDDSFVRAHCQKAHIRATDYRPDIDGLRAIAVLAVIVFHAFPNLLPGGFVGVDIFFVISGYLISKHILGELDSSSFKITTFYVRRAKRIFPALILVLLASAAFGWLMLTPVEYKLLGKSIAGGAGFVANFVFWNEAGYFDTAADTKPLLHLWSLGIEEQFYIVWPFLLSLGWRRATGRLGRIILLICGFSLLYSIWQVNRDVTADFYSPVSRLWELGLGSGLAYGMVHDKLTLGYGYRQLVAWFGLGMILIAVAVIEKTSFFPGAWALLPAVGAASLMYSGRAAWFNRAVLASRPMVWIGLISYPLYLWHWPLLAFARIMEAETPLAEVRLFLLILSVVLAWLTYRFVELPIRAKSVAQSRKLAVMLAAIMVLVLVAGLAIKLADGFKSRIQSQLNGDVATLEIGQDRQSLRKQCGIAEQQHLFDFCLSHGSESPSFAVLGDSKSEALYYGLARESRPGLGGILMGSVRPPKQEAAADDIRQIRNQLAMQTVVDSSSIKVVIYVVALRSSFKTNADTGFIDGDVGEKARDLVQRYSQAIKRLEQAGKRVVFVIDNPTLPDPRSCISGGMTSSPLLNQFLRRKPNPRCSISYSDHLAGTRAYRLFVAELATANPQLTIYDSSPLLCDIAGNQCSITRDGKFLYSYSDHISDYANSLIARDLLPKLEALMR